MGKRWKGGLGGRGGEGGACPPTNTSHLEKKISILTNISLPRCKGILITRISEEIMLILTPFHYGCFTESKGGRWLAARTYGYEKREVNVKGSWRYSQKKAGYLPGNFCPGDSKDLRWGQNRECCSEPYLLTNHPVPLSRFLPG